jgi:hypothetical protein
MWVFFLRQRAPSSSFPRFSTFTADRFGQIADGPRRSKQGVCTDPPVVRRLIVVINPMGLGTKNHCAGEDQQQCLVQVSSRPMTMCMLFPYYSRALETFSPKGRVFLEYYSVHILEMAEGGT